MDLRNIIIAALAAALVWLALDRSAHAGVDGGGGDADRGMIAVTGSYGSGASALYLVDTKTRHLAVYKVDNGRRLEFVAARDCSYDFMIESFHDQSSRSVLPSALRKSWRQLQRGEVPSESPTVPEEAETAGLRIDEGMSGLLPKSPKTLADEMRAKKTAAADVEKER